MSLADFVNRNPQSTSLEERLSGTLQSALDAETSVVVDGVEYGAPAINPRPTSLNAISSASMEVDYGFPEAVTGLRSRMAPGYLSQADLLSQIGPLLTVRGDTFLIRAYGESRDPVTGKVTGKAACEALVQRLPTYLADPDQNPMEVANSENQHLGREFRMLSFRWLDKSEF